MSQSEHAEDLDIQAAEADAVVGGRMAGLRPPEMGRHSSPSQKAAGAWEDVECLTDGSMLMRNSATGELKIRGT